MGGLRLWLRILWLAGGGDVILGFIYVGGLGVGQERGLTRLLAALVAMVAPRSEKGFSQRSSVSLLSSGKTVCWKSRLEACGIQSFKHVGLEILRMILLKRVTCRRCRYVIV